jgi:hypothetical protein
MTHLHQQSASRQSYLKEVGSLNSFKGNMGGRDAQCHVSPQSVVSIIEVAPPVAKSYQLKKPYMLADCTSGQLSNILCSNSLLFLQQHAGDMILLD